MNGGLGMRTSKNGKKKCRGTFLTNTNYMLCKNSGSLRMCTPKNKKKCIEGYSHILHIQYVVRMNALI